MVRSCQTLSRRWLANNAWANDKAARRLRPSHPPRRSPRVGELLPSLRGPSTTILIVDRYYLADLARPRRVLLDDVVPYPDPPPGGAGRGAACRRPSAYRVCDALDKAELERVRHRPPGRVLSRDGRLPSRTSLRPQIHHRGQPTPCWPAPPRPAAARRFLPCSDAPRRDSDLLASARRPLTSWLTTTW